MPGFSVAISDWNDDTPTVNDQATEIAVSGWGEPVALSSVHQQPWHSNQGYYRVQEVESDSDETQPALRKDAERKRAPRPDLAEWDLPASVTSVLLKAEDHEPPQNPPRHDRTRATRKHAEHVTPPQATAGTPSPRSHHRVRDERKRSELTPENLASLPQHVHKLTPVLAGEGALSITPPRQAHRSRKSSSSRRTGISVSKRTGGLRVDGENGNGFEGKLVSKLSRFII